MRPLVSIIMPAYNAAKHIGAAIVSILNQKINDFELIIVNDGSTDKTIEEIRKYSDPRIILINCQVNYKAPKARNLAIEIAKGKFIGLCDADDISLQRRLEVQVTYLENNPTVDVVGSGMYVIDDDGNIIGVLTKNKMTHEELVKNIQWFAPPVPHATIMAKGEWFKRHRYREKYFRTEDGDLFLRTYHNSKLALIPKPLYACRSPKKLDMKKLFHSNWQSLLIRWLNRKEYKMSPHVLTFYPLITLGRFYYHFILWLLQKSQMETHCRRIEMTDEIRRDEEWIKTCIERGKQGV